MAVPVMQIGIMGVLVAHRRVPMPMGMRLARQRVVIVTVMVVMGVRVIVFQSLVEVLVVMALRHMQPQSKCHQEPGKDQLRRHGIAKQEHGQQGADEWSKREVGSGPGRSEMAQRQHEHDEADADPEQADDGAGADQADAWQGRAKRQGEPDIGAAGDETFDHGDLNRISR